MIWIVWSTQSNFMKYDDNNNISFKESEYAQEIMFGDSTSTQKFHHKQS